MDPKVVDAGFKQLVFKVKELLEELDPETPLGYLETGYFLPTVYGFSGEKITKVSQLIDILDRLANDLLIKKEGDPLEKGLAALIILELFDAIRYCTSKDSLYTHPYTGFIPDPVFRKLGVPLVDGSIPGIGVILGEAPNGEVIRMLVRDLQKRSILVLLVGKVIHQLLETAFEVGLDQFVVPLGPDLESATHAVNLVVRMALSFGGITPGDQNRLKKYLEEKIPVFILSLGPLDNRSIAVASGLLGCGIPIINDQGLELPKGLTSERNYEKLVDYCLSVRGIKTKIEELPIPIDYGPAFEGQSVRKPATFVEFGGGRSLSFELLKMNPREEIKDGQIILQGRDVDQIEEGSILPLALIVEVAGKGMIEDFEPVLERRIHPFINYGDGIWHNAQRDINWLRISKEAVANGFKIKHLGDILYSKFHADFSEIVDKIQVKIYTDASVVERLLPQAKERYLKRDERLKNLKDEAVDTFYSCLLCQSFAPDHVCIISPQRTGLCGAVNWLDAKTSFEINPTGANQPVIKGKLSDPVLGRWKNINEYVTKESHGKITDVCLYSLMVNPLTSCGCFECIAAVIPEANGVMIVSREYSGDTPLGLPFSTLAGTVGGGVQTPGFMGISKNFIVSEKFLQAEGGVKRIIWMPKELKLLLAERIEQISPTLSQKIADEESAQTLEELLAYLSSVKHPALNMDPILR